jgi:hypothetical protein
MFGHAIRKKNAPSGSEFSSERILALRNCYSLLGFAGLVGEHGLLARRPARHHRPCKGKA